MNSSDDDLVERKTKKGSSEFNQNDDLTVICLIVNVCSECQYLLNNGHEKLRLCPEMGHFGEQNNLHPSPTPPFKDGVLFPLRSSSSGTTGDGQGSQSFEKSLNFRGSLNLILVSLVKSLFLC